MKKFIIFLVVLSSLYGTSFGRSFGRSGGGCPGGVCPVTPPEVQVVEEKPKAEVEKPKASVEAKKSGDKASWGLRGFFRGFRIFRR